MNAEHENYYNTYKHIQCGYEKVELIKHLGSNH